MTTDPQHLSEIYRILKGLDTVDVEKMFLLVGETRIQGHSFRVKGFRTKMRRNFFSQRVVNLWNSLPQKAVEAKSLSVFKTEIDKFLFGKAIKGYREKVGEWG